MTIPIFPNLAGLGWPIDRLDRSNTNVQQAVNGKKTRVQLWTYPEYEWTLSFNLLRTDLIYQEFQTMIGFFNQMAGQAGTFLYQDQDDNTVTNQVINTGDGVTTSFQLTRALGGFVEPIFAPNVVTGVTVGGVATTAYTINPYGTANPGTITFAVAPLADQVIEVASMTFYFPCGFSSDEMTFKKFMMNRYKVEKVSFVSLK